MCLRLILATLPHSFCTVNNKKNIYIKKATNFCGPGLAHKRPKDHFKGIWHTEVRCYLQKSKNTILVKHTSFYMKQINNCLYSLSIFTKLSHFFHYLHLHMLYWVLANRHKIIHVWNPCHIILALEMYAIILALEMYAVCQKILQNKLFTGDYTTTCFSRILLPQCIPHFCSECFLHSFSTDETRKNTASINDSCAQ